jgi:hypothetical protein
MICRHYTPMVGKRKQKTGRDAAAASESALVSDGKDLGGQSVRQVHQGTVESAGVVEEGIRQLIGNLLQRQGAGEAAALSGCALRQQSAAVTLGDLAAQGKAQT